MEITNAMKGYLSEEAQRAVAADLGNNSNGGSFDVAVGETVTLGKLDYREMWAQPRDIPNAEWEKLSDDERKERGRHTDWYVIQTDAGDMPIMMLLRSHSGVKWTAGKAEEKAFKPMTRKALAFIPDYGKYFGCKAKCVASADVVNEIYGNTVKHRLFVIEQKQP